MKAKTSYVNLIRNSSKSQKEIQKQVPFFLLIFASLEQHKTDKK